MSIAAFQHDPIGRNEIPRSKLDHIARHQLIDGGRGDDAVPADISMYCHRTFQGFGGALGPMLLEKIEPNREHDYGDNDGKAAEIPGCSRDRCRDQKNRHEWLGKTAADLANNVESGGLGHGVRTVARQPIVGLNPR